MQPKLKLARPPIVEALIDLRVDSRPDVDVSQLAALHDLLGKEAFPQVNKQMMSTIQFGDAPAEVTGSSHPNGLLFRSGDQTQVIQAQRDGFAYSRLLPYTSWEDVVANAKTRWAQYVQVAQPRIVKRVATRYINRVHIPAPVVSFADWIPKFPDVPSSLPQGIAEMFLRMVIPIPGAEQITAIVMQALEPYPPDGKVVTVVFDVDVFRAGGWSTDGDEVWDAVESLRPVKNAFFFEYLSTKTLELFK